MSILSIDEHHLLYYKAYILGLVTLTADYSEEHLVRNGTSLVQEAVQNRRLTADSANHLFIVNCPVRHIANSARTRAVAHATESGPTAHTSPLRSVANLFEQTTNQLSAALTVPSQLPQPNTAFDVDLRTSSPGLPIFPLPSIIPLAGGECGVDVLEMATHLSPLEYVLTTMAEHDASRIYQRNALRVRAYKDVITDDALQVNPTSGGLYRLRKDYDTFIARPNEISAQLPNIQCTSLGLVIVQLLHLARACFPLTPSLPDRQTNSFALAAFLNAGRWKLFLLAVYAARRDVFQRNSEENIDVDGQGKMITVRHVAEQILLRSQQLDAEPWFQIVQQLVEHLFAADPGAVPFPRQDAPDWMQAARPFAFANAGCGLIDARVAVQYTDCVAVRSGNIFLPSAWAEQACRRHFFFHSFALPGHASSSVTGGVATENPYDKEHYGSMGYMENLPRVEGTFGRMIVRKDRGWHVSVPTSESISISVPKSYKGTLFVQNGAFHFEQTGVSKRVVGFISSINNVQVMSSGAGRVPKAERQPDGKFMAELVLSGKAGLEGARWVWQHLIFGSVRVGAKRPSFLGHLVESEDGITVTQAVTSEMMEQMEVVLDGDDNVYIPIKASDVVPDYRIVMGTNGFAKVEKADTTAVPIRAASVRIGVNLS